MLWDYLEIEGNSQKDKLVVYPGRFAPFHVGHLSSYNELVSKFGRDQVYILTKDYPEDEDPKNPFSFKEKKKMMELAGVPSNKIFLLKGSAYNHLDILKSIGGNLINKVLISVMSKEDAKRIKTGEDRYYQGIWKDQKKPKKIKTAGYIYFTKVVEADKRAKISSTKIREAILKNKLSLVKSFLPEAVYNYLKRKYLVNKFVKGEK